MADSENSRSPSGVTRRALLAGTAATPMMASRPPRAADNVTAEPLVDLYQRWLQADAEEFHWGRKWGELETALARNVGYPRVPIALPSTAAPVWVSTHDDIDREIADSADKEIRSAALHADLTDLQMRWNTEAETVGLSDAEHQQELAWEKRQTLANRVFSLPGRDLAEVIMKLTIILRTGKSRERDNEFPWPQIESVIHDVRRLAQTSACS